MQIFYTSGDKTGDFKVHNLISKAVESHSLNAEELLELLKNDAINPELLLLRSAAG